MKRTLLILLFAFLITGFGMAQTSKIKATASIDSTSALRSTNPKTPNFNFLKLAIPSLLPLK